MIFESFDLDIILGLYLWMILIFVAIDQSDDVGKVCSHSPLIGQCDIIDAIID